MDLGACNVFMSHLSGKDRLTTVIFKPPPPVGAGGGYMFSGRPSVRASVRPCVRSSVRPCVRDSRGSFHRGGGAAHSTLPSSATFSSCILDPYYSRHS